MKGLITNNKDLFFIFFLVFSDIFSEKYESDSEDTKTIFLL